MDTLNKILNLIEEKGLTQQAVLNELACGRSFFSDWKTGKIKNPPIEKIVRFAKYFNVSTDYLLGVHDDKENLINTEDKKSFNTIVKEAMHAYFSVPYRIDILSIKTGIPEDEIKSYIVNPHTVYDDDTIANCPALDKYLKLLEFNPAAQKQEACLKLLFELNNPKERNFNITEEKLREIIRDEMSNAKISSHEEPIKKA